MDNKLFPLVSVGIPTYNRSIGLNRTLVSIIKQTYSNLEIIISNNFSSDPEVERVAKSFSNSDSRIKYYKQSENIGNANNFKFVLEKSKGQYFMWAPDDDTWDENYISECMRVFFENTDCVSVFSHFDLINLRTNQVVGRATPNSTSSDLPFVRFRLRLQEMMPNLIYGLHQINIIKKIKIDYYDWSDVLFTAELAFYGKILIIPQFLYHCGIDGSKRKPYALTGKYFDFSIFLNHLSAFMKGRFTFSQRIRILAVTRYYSFIARRNLNKAII